ncbi:MAG TPA: ATPase P [Thermodesulfobacteriota bacterium]|jgi:soluble P-type ATPase|nr:ATPase P [Thermodesulfobacteriota bacterium]
MISIERPAQSNIEIEFVLIDFEGTLASDRQVHPKAKDKINLLSKRTKIYILVNPPTPLFNKGGKGGILAKEKKELVEEKLRKVKAEIVYLEEGDASQRKLDLLRNLGAMRCVAIGNGVDDAPMIQEAGFGICILGKEGASSEALKNADVVFVDILDALDFLLKPLRQKATLSL